MYRHEIQIRVRYGETDQMGYLYYGNYALYYEVGRVESLRSLGLVYKEWESELGIALPVVTLQSRYIRPVYYDEMLRVRSEIRTMPERSITFFTEIYNEKDEIVNTSQIKLVFIDIKSGKRIDAPAILVDKLIGHFE